MKRRRTGAASNEKRLAKWLEVAGRYTVPGLVVTKPSKKWLRITRGGQRISVPAAVKANLKVNSRKKAVECRCKALTTHLLTHLVDVLKTARCVGWDENAIVDGPGKPVQAVQYIMQTVDRGSTVKLYPYDKSMPWVYLHSDDKGSYVPHTMVVCDGCL